MGTRLEIMFPRASELLKILEHLAQETQADRIGEYVDALVGDYTLFVPQKLCTAVDVLCDGQEHGISMSEQVQKEIVETLEAKHLFPSRSQFNALLSIIYSPDVCVRTIEQGEAIVPNQPGYPFLLLCLTIHYMCEELLNVRPGKHVMVVQEICGDSLDSFGDNAREILGQSATDKDLLLFFLAFCLAFICDSPPFYDKTSIIRVL